MSHRLVLSSTVLGTLLVLACVHAGFVPQPTAVDVERIQPVDPGLTLAEMQAGRAAYVQRCSSCHAVHGPAEFRGDQWPELLARMQREKKIKIPDHERALMERYLVAFSSTAPRPADAGVVAPGLVGSGQPSASR
jgi:Dihaem cytochrome c.